MIHRTLVAGLVCLGLNTGTIGAAESHASQKADFHAFVNWDFRYRKKLKGWQATATAIQKTIEQWYPRRPTHTVAENGTPESLRRFLYSLPKQADCDLSIVYLASHQSPEGEWDFVQKKLQSIPMIAAESDIPKHSGRIVIVDACFAAALHQDPGWNRALQSSTLFASSASEETKELDFRSPHPIDLRRRYPAATAWLDRQLGKDWDGRLSFLGFVWVQTFVTSAVAPTDQKGWSEFLRRCEATAEKFRRDADKRLASRILFSPSSDSPHPHSERSLR